MESSLSIFMPFYNDAGTVDYMISEAFNCGNSLTDDLEVIAVNDGSTDHTLEELLKMKVKFPSLTIINHPHNRGYGGAIISGIQSASKDWVFYTDGDAQYHLEELKNMWAVKSHYDVLNGYKLRRSDNVLRKIVGAAYSEAVKFIFRSPILDIDCDYRLMRGEMLRKIKLHCKSGAITVELVKKLHLNKARFKEFGVQHYHRSYGQSTFFTFGNILKTFRDEVGIYRELNKMRK